MQQQERALSAYVDTIRADEDVLAVVVVGSVARGDERSDSDVDLYLIVTDERFDRSVADDRFAWVERPGMDYPGSYIDVKLASPRYLEIAALRGDDPTKASFAGARIAFTRIDGLDELIKRIPMLPDEAWRERVRSHLAQARLHGGYFLRQGVERGDAFLVRHAAVNLALAAACAALAANRVLMRGPKYLSALVREVSTPARFVSAWDALVADPGHDTAQTVTSLLDEWLGEYLGLDETLSLFIRDNELAWLLSPVRAASM